MPTPKSAFSMVELLIALSIIAVIAGLTIPKLMGGAGDAELKTKLRQIFTIVGEGMESRKKDDSLIPIAGNETSEPLTFYTFLYQNINFVTAVAPNSLASASTLCTPANYIQFHNGTVLRAICAYDPTGGLQPPIGLDVTLQVPVNANTTTTFTERLRFNSDNYTTVRGDDLNNSVAVPSACTLSDAMLNVDPTCEGTAP